jgi:hypothetical protein
VKAAIPVSLSFEQLLLMVKQLPVQQKIKLSKELEKEAIGTKLTRLLKSLKTKELDFETLTNEVEIVRQAIYDKRKH